ncbi:MAG: holo-ACP synthase [Pseudomonadota bacterium]
MIIGIGNDLCNIERIQGSLDKFGEKFENRCFTEGEITKARKRLRTAETYAKRFAAKEACAKALGTGVPRRGVHWKHMEVINLPSGKPTLKLTEGAAERLAEITPDGHNAKVHLTMTDDHPWAEAQVIIEAHPK